MYNNAGTGSKTAIDRSLLLLHRHRPLSPLRLALHPPLAPTHVPIRLPIRSSVVKMTTNIRMDNVLMPISPISSCPPAWGPGQSPLSTSDCSWLPRLRNDISLLLVIFDCNLSPFLPATSSHDDALTLKPAPCARTWHLCMIAAWPWPLRNVLVLRRSRRMKGCLHKAGRTNNAWVSIVLAWQDVRPLEDWQRTQRQRRRRHVTCKRDAAYLLTQTLTAVHCIANRFDPAILEQVPILHGVFRANP
jgi:hypothetical protein